MLTAKEAAPLWLSDSEVADATRRKYPDGSLQVNRQGAAVR